MRISVEDLRMALQWIKENSNDVNINIVVEAGKCVLRTGTPDQEIVNITLFDSDARLEARVTKEDYLKHNVKLKT